jgi:hypothetical protein
MAKKSDFSPVPPKNKALTGPKSDFFRGGKAFALAILAGIGFLEACQPLITETGKQNIIIFEDIHLHEPRYLQA